ncbi:MULTISPECIES: helix-turn-helix domain-containing protein [Bacteroides]|uniref:helix-turn-helix domain-containing protein n=1 Tax=Bacteroides TaxID=816 RepID=UPI0034A1861E
MRIKEILREKGITAKELASTIGMTETGLSIAISENGNPPLKRLEQIATALGVPVTDLFDKPTNGVIHCPNCGKEIKLNPEV